MGTMKLLRVRHTLYSSCYNSKESTEGETFLGNYIFSRGRRVERFRVYQIFPVQSFCARASLVKIGLYKSSSSGKEFKCGPPISHSTSCTTPHYSNVSETFSRFHAFPSITAETRLRCTQPRCFRKLLVGESCIIRFLYAREILKGNGDIWRNTHQGTGCRVQTGF